MSKKRILFLSEASFLSTGFSTINRELLQRLAATGKYELGEIGSYARPDDPRIESFIKGRWKFWGNMPTTQEESNEFGKPSSNPRDKGQNINQFGANIFDKVCAEFQPDILVCHRDNWMDSFTLRSPFRSWFKLFWYPTVDSHPQAEEWIQDYELCDLVGAYSDYGIHVLKQQSKKIRLFPTPMRPGVDLTTFKPLDKKAIREKYCLNPDIPIIGTVQRNQSRKQILDLIDGFALMKKRFKGVPEVDKAVLLLHTSWPDNAFSFDYPRHIMRLQTMDFLPYSFKGIKDNVLQTMMCHSCGKKFVTFAVNLHGKPIQQVGSGAAILQPCMWCGQNTATCPTTGGGFEREELAEIYNLMDIYVQASIAEGDGMPVNEAKACGVPTLVTDYSATAEKGRFPKEYIHLKERNVSPEDYTVNLGGDVLEVSSYRHEPETGCFRAFTSPESICNQLHEYLINHTLRQQKSLDARKCAEENYDWDKLAKQWEFVLDNIIPKDRSKTWESPIELLPTVVVKEVPPNLTDEQYVEFLYINILSYPRIDPEGAKMWITYLKQGVSRDTIMQQFINIGQQQINDTQARQKLRAEAANIQVKTQIKADWI